MTRSVCVVTGTRAEYGLLEPLMRALRDEPGVSFRIVATGAHLSPDFGSTYLEIEKDGYSIDRKIEILLASDSRAAVNKAIGLAFIGFGDYFEERRPDLLIVLGDRYETFAAACAAAISGIPIAHIHGGESTEGAADEFLRHSITKMSHLHFTSADAYARRVVQLGESPDTVFNVGALGLDNARREPSLSGAETRAALSLGADDGYALATLHPETLGGTDVDRLTAALLEAVDAVPGVKVVFTKANADAGGRGINEALERFAAARPDRAVLRANLGRRLYLSALRHCSFVIGNSSSGIIEAPYFRVPTVNIGDRQRGRIAPASVIDCPSDPARIAEAPPRALDPEFRRGLASMPQVYGDGHATERIMERLRAFLARDDFSPRKRFHDLRIENA